ncbi:unnamed protein product [Natator depressus]
MKGSHMGTRHNRSKGCSHPGREVPAAVSLRQGVTCGKSRESLLLKLEQVPIHSLQPGGKTIFKRQIQKLDTCVMPGYEETGAALSPSPLCAAAALLPGF